MFNSKKIEPVGAIITILVPLLQHLLGGWTLVV